MLVVFDTPPSRLGSYLFGKGTFHSTFAKTTYSYPETSSSTTTLRVDWACKAFDTSLMSVSNAFCGAGPLS